MQYAPFLTVCLPFSMQWKRIDITDILLEQEKVMKA